MRAAKLTFAAALFALLAAPQAAFAQPAPLVDAVGSSGTLAAAALETAGYYYQSFLLDAYMGPMEGALGSLIYIIGALVGLIVFLGMGNYKFAAWFFLGPGLFFSAVAPRTDAPGVDWVWGSEQRNSVEAKNSAEGMAADDRGLTNVQGYTPRISSLFGWYNKLISTSVREIVGTINSGRTKSDVRFLMRAELFSNLKTSYIQDPEFKQVLHVAMLGQCREAMEAGREWREIDPPQRGTDPNNPGPDDTWPMGNHPGWSGEDWSNLPEHGGTLPRNDAPTNTENIKLCNADGSHPGPQHTLSSRQCQLKMRYRDLISKRVPLGDDGWRYLAKLKLAYGNTGIFDDAVHNPKDIQNILSTMKQEQQNGGSAPSAQQIRQTAAQLRRDFHGGLSCLDVWNIAYVGVYRFAMMQTDRVLNETEKATQTDAPGSGLTRQEIVDEWNKISGSNPGEDPNLPVNLYSIIAHTLFKNEMNTPTTAGFIGGFVERSAEFTSIGVEGENDLALTERVRIGAREWQEKTELMNTAATMPYYQGLALYFLSVLYPFFALLLLIPGKHGGFLLWFSMWLWVKSWDIGYAVVMLLDDALFSMMVARNYDNPATTNGFDMAKNMHSIQHDLATSIYMMQEADPTFQLGTYYAIIGIALQSIPIVSSYLLLGSLRGGAGLISQGIKTVAEFQGTAAAHGSGQAGLNNQRAGALQAVMGAAGKALENAKSGSDGGAPSGSTSGWIGIQGGNLRSGNWRSMSLGDSNNFWGSLFSNPTNNMLGGSLQMAGVTGGLQGFERGGFVKKVSNLGMNAVDAVGRNSRMADRADSGGRGGPASARTRRIRSAQGRVTSKGKVTKGAGRVVGIISDCVAKPLATLTNQGYHSLNNIRNADIDKVIEWARYDAMNSAAVQRRSALGRVYGAIEIPWTIEGGFDQELNARLTRMREGFNMAGAGVQAAGEVVQGIIGDKQGQAQQHFENKNRGK